jgi:hypothetical protein
MSFSLTGKSQRCGHLSHEWFRNRGSYQQCTHQWLPKRGTTTREEGAPKPVRVRLGSWKPARLITTQVRLLGRLSRHQKICMNSAKICRVDQSVDAMLWLLSACRRLSWMQAARLSAPLLYSKAMTPPRYHETHAPDIDNQLSLQRQQHRRKRRRYRQGRHYLEERTHNSDRALVILAHFPDDPKAPCTGYDCASNDRNQYIFIFFIDV